MNETEIRKLISDKIEKEESIIFSKKKVGIANRLESVQRRGVLQEILFEMTDRIILSMAKTAQDNKECMAVEFIQGKG